MSRNPIHSSAGWYDGDDPAMAKAFRTMQRNFQRLPRDPVVKITATQTKGGCYACDWYDDRSPLDPTVAGNLDALAGRTKMNGSFLAVNGLENGANTHTVPLGSIVPATLQYRVNGEPYFVFGYPPRASGGTGCVARCANCIGTQPAPCPILAALDLPIPSACIDIGGGFYLNWSGAWVSGGRLTASVCLPYTSNSSFGCVFEYKDMGGTKLIAKLYTDAACTLLDSTYPYVTVDLTIGTSGSAQISVVCQDFFGTAYAAYVDNVHQFPGSPGAQYRCDSPNTWLSQNTDTYFGITSPNPTGIVGGTIVSDYAAC